MFLWFWFRSCWFIIIVLFFYKPIMRQTLFSLFIRVSDIMIQSIFNFILAHACIRFRHRSLSPLPNNHPCTLRLHRPGSHTKLLRRRILHDDLHGQSSARPIGHHRQPIQHAAPKLPGLSLLQVQQPQRALPAIVQFLQQVHRVRNSTSIQKDQLAICNSHCKGRQSSDKC